MKMRYRVSPYLSAALLLSVYTAPVGAQSAFNVMPDSAGPTFRVNDSENSEKKRQKDEVLWGLAGAGLVGALLVNGSGADTTAAAVRTEPMAEASLSYQEGTVTFSSKRRDGGFNAPEPGSFTLLLAAGIPLLPLVKRYRRSSAA